MPTLKRAYIMLFALAVIATLFGFFAGNNDTIILGAVYLTGAILANAMCRDFEGLIK